MHQTRKAKDWYFGMQALLGVDNANKIIPMAVVTSANVADSTVLRSFLHGEETRVWGAIRDKRRSFTSMRLEHASAPSVAAA